MASQLLECCYDWNKSADEGKPTDVAYIEFSKAFYNILQNKFAHKLKSYNFSDNTVKWLLAFLTIRTHALKCNNTVSSVSLTLSNPEGSVCGSLIFIFFINNLPSICLPWLLQDINLIESVQRSFTRCVCLICHLPLVSYEERLSMFKLVRLELRHLHIDLTNLFKIVQHFSACNIVLNFYYASHKTRGYSFKLVLCRTNKSYLKYFFIASLMVGILCLIIVLTLI